MLLLENAHIVNEGEIWKGAILINGDKIEKIYHGDVNDLNDNVHRIDLKGKYVMPGMIDDQVHFREPGLTHKADIQSESRAAVAGGITSFMEMPNTKPQTLTQELLAEKFDRASEVSVANYSFFMGASNDNLDEVLATDVKNVCGLKVFMGSSTGNMLVDSEQALSNIFSKSKMLIATHCEEEAIVRGNLQEHIAKYGDDIPIQNHPVIRSREACYASSSKAVELAKKFGTRLHILHISTKEELDLFQNDLPLRDKRITSEACAHHLFFDESAYMTKGSHVKWNPAVKGIDDRNAIREAVKDGRIDVLATDHAPHTLEEKANPYTSAPSGGPLVQHALVSFLELYHQGIWSLELIVEKMAHNVATCFQIKKRGFIREGYFADLVVVDLNSPWTVTKENILYKCAWSPFEDYQFTSKVEYTFVNGKLIYENGMIRDDHKGNSLQFDR
ncbi:MAG: dihydroorotase [Flavobacteriales bacterium]|nr:dihydroorotase [Flavobacteriales bacterium]